jgi:hypothetical protein
VPSPCGCISNGKNVKYSYFLAPIPDCPSSSSSSSGVASSINLDILNSLLEISSAEDLDAINYLDLKNLEIQDDK